MKKFLSLVLALVMTMSLVTISAGAKDFADDSDIDYKEAVDVISALGIVDGYSDSSFRPDGSLTRGAAAKIICNLILGPTTASALSASTAPFRDVPTTNTFAGFITYCSQQGIISGYADGTFRPTGTLTGNAFMKMLLGALGYSSSIEGYTGSNWTVNVIKQAVGIGLDDGNDSFVGSQTVTREEACLYAFNMLQATMVEYSSTSTVVVGDVQVSTAASRSDVANTSSRTDGNIDDDELMQFAERYFTDLEKRDGTDSFGRPATVWVLDGDEIGTYANDADDSLVLDKDLSYNDMMEDNADYFSLRSSEISRDVEVYLNGDRIASSTYGTGTYFQAGDVVELYENDDGDVETVAVTRYSLAKIDTVDDDLSASLERQGATYAIDLTDLDAGTFADVTGTYYDDHDNDSVVLNGFSASTYTEGTVLAVAANSNNEILASHVTEEVTGTVSRYNSGSKASITVGGEAYPVTAKARGQFTSFSFNDAEYTLYVDENGYVVGFETSGSVQIDDVYYVTGVVRDGNGRYNTVEYYAQAVALDGTVSEIEIEAAAYYSMATGREIAVSTNSADNYVYLANGSGTYYKQSDGSFDTTGSGQKYSRYADMDAVISAITSSYGSEVAAANVLDTTSAGLYTFTDSDGDQAGSRSNNDKFTAEAYNHTADSAYYVALASDFTEDLTRSASSVTLSGATVNEFGSRARAYVNDNTQYIKIETPGSDIDVTTVTGGTSATMASTDAVAVIASKSGNNYTAAYVVLVSNGGFDSVAADADILYVDSASNDRVARDQWENTVYFVDGTGEQDVVTNIAGTANTFYTYVIENGVYELTPIDSDYYAYSATGAESYEDKTGAVYGATLTGIYEDQLSGTKTKTDSNTFTFDDVAFADDVVIVDSRPASDKNDDAISGDITTISRLENAIDRNGSADADKVHADLFLDDGEVILVVVLDMADADVVAGGPDETSYHVDTPADVTLSASGISVANAVILDQDDNAPDTALNVTATIVVERMGSDDWGDFATIRDISGTIATTTGALTLNGGSAIPVGVVANTSYRVTITLTGEEIGTLTLVNAQTYSFTA